MSKISKPAAAKIKNSTMTTVFKWLLIGGILLAVFAALRSSDLVSQLTFENLKAKRDLLQAQAENQPWLFVLTYFATYVVVTAAAIPGATILTLAGGAIFGLGKGLLLVSFASTLGATLSFLITRYLLRASVEAKFRGALEKINDGLKREGTVYLLTLRLIPVFPFFLVNLVLGLTSISTLRFALVSQLGMLPGTFFYVNAGTQIATLGSPSEVLSPTVLASLVALGVFPLVASLLIRIYKRHSAFRGFPRPEKFDYNLVAIGGGAAGLVTSYIGAVAKAKVALIEEHRMGGDCLNTGCVPSKAILQSAKIAYEVDSSHAFGVNVDLKTKSVDFQKVMALVQDKIRAIEPHDSIERYTSLGVECLTGRAKLKSPWEIEVTDAQKKTRVVTARSIVVATGAAPIVPDIEGLRECGPLTSETLWQLKELPKKLMVLGGGPIGCELALAFSRLGAEVTLIERGASILSREDLEVSALLQKSLEKNGVRVKLKTNIVRFEAPGPFQKGEAAPKRALTEAGDRLEFDQVLVALGRRARTSGLGLEQLGIEVENNGTISRSETLQTSMPNIFVCGDVAGPWQFTHTAAHQAWFAAVNALVDPFWSFKVDERVIPAVTYTDPEIARVGLNEREATEKGIDFEVTRYDLDDLDRAIVDSKAEGFVKVLTPPNSDQILGATIVGAHAGELLAEFTLAMKHGLGLGKILGTIHPYPTYSEASKYTAGVWRKAHAPQAALKFAAAFFNFRRS